MYIEQQAILDATRGGLDIIISYYPQAEKAALNARKEFKIREEKTASARLKQLKDNNWVVTDFGDDSVPRNGIQVVMKEDNISFREAVVMLAAKYNVGGLSKEIHKSNFEKRPAKPDEEEGAYYFEIKKELSDSDFKEVFPNYKPDNKERCANVLKKFNVHALDSFTQIKNREALVTESTDNYPIFMVEHENFKKIYQPCNPEKQYRFRYTGTRPKDYVNGLAQLRKQYETYKLDQEKEWKLENAEKENAPTLIYKKLDSVIIASGERDALNIAEYGYNVIWLNSETAKLTPATYKELKKYCNDVFLCPDIDSTGRKSALRTSLEYLDIRIIWLPQKLLRFRDNRGKPRKDFKDFIELYPQRQDFHKLYKAAIPLRFWDEEFKDKGIKYQFNNEQAYAFLAANGYYRIENKNEKDGFSFIYMDGNIVEIIRGNRAKEFVLNFLRENHYHVNLINLIHKTNQLSDNALGGLPKIDIDFTDFDDKTQFLFFNNHTWEVTPTKVIEHKSTNVERYVWDEEVIKHKVKRIAPAFTTQRRKDGSYELEVKNTESKFFSYLINASRIYWREELEVRAEQKLKGEELDKYIQDNKFNIAGSLLDSDEQEEQKQHLLNKIFAIGYLLHRYKDDPRAWAVFAMDNKISDIGESNGRSGKSYCFKFLQNFMKTVVLGGRNPKLTDNPHVYDRVTEHTDLILVDDAHQYLNFNFFFGDITGDMVVNPKNNVSYNIPFENSPKIVITSNFTLRDIDSSTEDRILYTVFSDYYHAASSNNDYRETRKIYDDFNKTLHKADYTKEEWNLDFNFIADCIQFYLSVPSPQKISPPMGNVAKRNLRTIMGDTFKTWADTFFDKEIGRVDEFVARQDAIEDFEKVTKQRGWTTNKFTKAMKAWAEYTEYVQALNPREYQNSEGRISRQHNGKAADMLYVKTKELNPADLNDEADVITETDEKPF